MQNGNGGLSIEQMYQKKTQLEHILLRPDTYIGSVERTTELMWVYDEEKNRMQQRQISFVPGLYKIFDEILVNAADNKQRDKGMNTIKVEIDPEKNMISVWNNGQGIPVTMHKEEKMYVPTMIFGHLLTSSNYNDDEKKVTGGRNGYGAKLCNIFSTKFVVETATKEYKRSFKQSWSANMLQASDPHINHFNGSDYTKITFCPDLAKFKMDRLDDDIVALMSRRAFDVAASTKGVAVYLNGTKVPVKNFKDYIDLFMRNPENEGPMPVKIVYEQCGERWEVACCLSERGFQQMSFVNSIATTKGGRHVDHVVDNIIKQLIEGIKKKNKGGITIKPFQVRNHLWVFVNSLIENPTFDSQTKENMTLQAKSFGSKCVLSEKFINNVSKSGIIEAVLSWAKFKAQNDIAKSGGRKQTKIKNMPKLEDANEAGGKNAYKCTLILTEGDSAKSLAVSGLGVIGRDFYGVFPLRGKLLNVREATFKQLAENAEINNLCKIIGLQYKKKYLSEDDIKTLRYGKVMIMTDQDQDGSHIKGLLINFIHTNWPELLRLPFLEEFITPIVKVSKGNVKLSFYSLPELEEWKLDTPDHAKYKTKYYKGLGTSTSAEAKEYFKDMERHRIVFRYDGSVDDESIMMAFSRKHIDARKEWLNCYMDENRRRKMLKLPERYLYAKGTKDITYSDFVNLELVLFSHADNQRSIPSLVDGFKPGQRKVLFTCFKRKLKNEMKVAQLSGAVAELSAYHHGEVSLQMTIVNLAQNYVGSNNINLLEPRGQFGTRLTGGKDCASARYIFTLLSPLSRLIFHPDDDPLLSYLADDGKGIEPEFYMPIIPMILVNGADGIGTGWSTKIFNHNPRDLIKNIRLMLADEEPIPMHPWYKNFKGSIDYVAEGRYMSSGNIQIVQGDKIEISELPVCTWTQTYKENVLEPLLNGSEKVKPIISDYREYHTDTTVRFVITLAAGEFDRLSQEDGGFYRVFKLSSSMSTNQMHCFDHLDYLRRFSTPLDILKEFYPLRLEYYNRRKEYLVGQKSAHAESLSAKARFILEKCDGTLVIENKKKAAMIEELKKRGYPPNPMIKWVTENSEKYNSGEGETQEQDEEDEDTGKESKDKDKGEHAYDYLLGLAMWYLTEEKKNRLLHDRDQILSELAILKKTTKEDMWLNDLYALEQKLEEVEEMERRDEAGINKMALKAMQSNKAKAAGAQRKRQSKGAKLDVYPDPDGVKIEFKITEEIVKKVATAVSLASKVKKEKVDKKVKTEPGAGADNGEKQDEFDSLVDGGLKGPKGAAAAGKKEKKENTGEKKPRGRKKKDEDGMKQTKLSFAPKSSKKKGSSDSEDDMNLGTVVAATRPERPGRASAKKIDYAGLLDSEPESISSDSEFDIKEDSSPTKKATTKRIRKVASFSDSSDLDRKKKKKKPAVSDDDDNYSSDFE